MVFDEMEVNQNIGAKGLVVDLKIKQEIIGHFMSITYPEEEEVQVETKPCEYDYMGTYYRTFDREELEEAQHQISEQMDTIDQEFITRKEPAVARGAARYRTVGTGDDDDNDNAKGDDDEETEIEYNDDEKDDNHQETTENDNLVIMNPDNGTGLQIKNVISFDAQAEPMDVDQPKAQHYQETLKCSIVYIPRVDNPQYKGTSATPVPGKQPVSGEQPVPEKDPVSEKQPVSREQPVPEEDPVSEKQPAQAEPPVTEDPPFIPRVKQMARKSTKQKQNKQKSKKDKKSKKGSEDEEPKPDKCKHRTSIRLAGGEAQELQLPKHITPKKKDTDKTKQVPVNPASIKYSKVGDWDPQVFTTISHPKPSLPQQITGGKKANRSIATQVVQPLRARKFDSWHHSTRVELHPGKDEFVRAPLFRTKDTKREDLISKVQATAKKERSELIKRGIQPYSSKKITVLDKRHNFKPGALALAEIRHYQEVEGLILSPTVMKRLCLEIARELNPAYRLLHKASEEYLMRIYRDCAMVASLNNKVTVDERDMLVVRRISGDYGRFNTWGTGYQQRVQPERMTEDETTTSKEGYKSQFAQWKSDWAEKKASRKQAKENIKKK